MSHQNEGNWDKFQRTNTMCHLWYICFIYVTSLRLTEALFSRYVTSDDSVSMKALHHAV